MKGTKKPRIKYSWEMREDNAAGHIITTIVTEYKKPNNINEVLKRLVAG